MPTLDVWKSDAFNSISLSEAINILPAQPGRLGQMGLFEFKGVPTTNVMIEDQTEYLALLPAVSRGAPATPATGRARQVTPFNIPHLPYDRSILAADVQDIRQFGSENQLEAVSTVVNDALTDMRACHESTWEWYRAGAIQGKIYDADGSTVLIDLFTAFNKTETSVAITMANADDVKLKSREITRHIADVLGGIPHSGVHCMCGKDFYDALITSANVKAAYDRWQEGRFLRDDQREGFPFAGIYWEEYTGKVGSQSFVDDAKARAFPTGVRGLFKEFFGPADFVEAANTIGKRLYAKQERMKFDKGVDIHSQSNPLMLCTRPTALVEVTTA